MTIIAKENFTIYHGDTLEILPRLIAEGLRAKCLVCDPPYRLTSGGPSGILRGKFDPKNYDNGGNLFDDCPEWAEFMPLFYQCLEERAHAYIMADSKNQFEMQLQAMYSQFRFHNLLQWRKGNYVPNRWYMKGIEFTGFFFKGAAYAINDCGSKQDVYMPQDPETDHPTEKPVLLMQHYIENSTQPGELVIDPFMGSGSTAVAALRSGRRFVGIEKNEKYFNMALGRMKNAHQHAQADFF